MSALILNAYPVRAAILGACLLAIANLAVDPGKMLLWGGVLVLSVAGLLAAVTLGRGGSQPRRAIRASLFGAALILSGALAISLGETLGLIDDVPGQRLFGVMLGLVLVVTGNFLPKTARSLIRTQCDAARLQGIERISGWLLVLAGLAHTGIWLFAPADRANTAAMMVVAAALFLIAAVWMVLSRRDRTA